MNTRSKFLVFHWRDISKHSFEERFDERTVDNRDLDVGTKRATLKASASVVSIVSCRGGEAFFRGSGTVIECEEVDGVYFSTILTSASLLRSSPELNAVPDDIKLDVHFSDGKSYEGHVFACDFHYNIATIKIKSDAARPTAILRRLDDSITICPSAIPSYREDPISGSFLVSADSDLFKLCPGDMVVALGRFFKAPYDLMAASGKFSLVRCKFGCRELIGADCLISKSGIGGPLINPYGEVIGINFYDELCTPFLPINIVSKFLEHFKKNGNYCRPWLGMGMTNLHEASVSMLEQIIQKFPNIGEGVLVRKVLKGSPAESAGISWHDVIVQCGSNVVRSVLEFCEIICDKVGESVEVVVIRNGTRLNLTMVVGETSPDKFNRWPLPPPEKYMEQVPAPAWYPQAHPTKRHCLNRGK